MSYIELFRSLDPSLIALTVMAILVVATVVSWHRNKDGFDLSQCILDSATGRISVEKIGFMSVLAVYIWGFIHLALKNTLSMEYVGLGLATFAAARFGSQWLSVKKDVATPPQGEQ